MRCRSCDENRFDVRPVYDGGVETVWNAWYGRNLSGMPTKTPVCRRCVPNEPDPPDDSSPVARRRIMAALAAGVDTVEGLAEHAEQEGSPRRVVYDTLFVMSALGDIPAGLIDRYNSTHALSDADR